MPLDAPSAEVTTMTTAIGDVLVNLVLGKPEIAGVATTLHGMALQRVGLKFPTGVLTLRLTHATPK